MSGVSEGRLVLAMCLGICLKEKGMVVMVGGYGIATAVKFFLGGRRGVEGNLQ
jgi:hypothetical protein